jgi:RNA polymerase II-associated factor 1
MAMNQVRDFIQFAQSPNLTQSLAIQAMPAPPPLHPADRALMRPPNALGKAASNSAGISFLRRTEYTTSYTKGGSQFESSNSSNTIKKISKRRRQVNLSEDHPTNIAKHIMKGFDLAYPEDAYTGLDNANNLRAAEISPEDKQAWKFPVHPGGDKKLQLMESYPLLPDWDAIPDTGSYMMYKFMAPPSNKGTYDPRLDVALLRPAGQTIDDYNRYQQDLEAYNADKTGTVPKPRARYHFEFFLPPDKEKVPSIKRNFSTFDPDNEDEISFDRGQDDEGRPRKCFKYENIRTYETAQQTGDMDDAYGDTVALALHDPEVHNEGQLRNTKLQKAAYFYPIQQRTGIKPRRPGKFEMVGGEQAKVHVIETVAKDADIQEGSRAVTLKKYHAIEV